MALAKQALAQADIDAGRLIAPHADQTAVDFAYYVVHPKAKGRLPQVKAFVKWLKAEAALHEQSIASTTPGPDLGRALSPPLDGKAGRSPAALRLARARG